LGDLTQGLYYIEAFMRISKRKGWPLLKCFRVKFTAAISRVFHLAGSLSIQRNITVSGFFTPNWLLLSPKLVDEEISESYSVQEPVVKMTMPALLRFLCSIEIVFFGEFLIFSLASK
jgi:hypothetical protein